MKKRNIVLLIIALYIVIVSPNVYAETCNGVFDGDFILKLNDYVFTPIKWLTPVALLVLTSIDFAGVVFSGDKKGMDKAKNNFLKRSVAALIIFFAPDIINLIVKLINDQSIASCMEQFGLKN